MFPEASSAAALSNKAEYPNVMRVNAAVSKLGKGALAVMNVRRIITSLTHSGREKLAAFTRVIQMSLNLSPEGSIDNKQSVVQEMT